MRTFSWPKPRTLRWPLTIASSTTCETGLPVTRASSRASSRACWLILIVVLATPESTRM